MKIEYVPVAFIGDYDDKAFPQDIPVVRLAVVDQVLAEAVWAMETVKFMSEEIYKLADRIVPGHPLKIADDLDVKRAHAFLASPAVAEWRKREEGPKGNNEPKQTVRRSCNRHEDCDKADAQGRTIHCSTEDCEDCFGK